jgi:retron-type reverse transcriptase
MMHGVVKIVLGTIYEPRFLRVSHGFHLDHLCYATFRHIKQDECFIKWNFPRMEKDADSVVGSGDWAFSASHEDLTCFGQ